MKKIAVFFGGKTVEHDVSIVTGLQLMENMDSTLFEAVPIYITREGDWYTGAALKNVEVYKNFDKGNPQFTRCYLPANTRGRELYAFHPKKSLFQKEQSLLCRLDAAIPAMHGLNGEDGTLQGLLELAGVPYTSCGVLGSAAGMDKVLMKSAFKGAGLPVLPYIYIDRGDWPADKEDILHRAESAFSYPMFVKPANLGSSIGISKAKNREELENAIAVAAHYDRRVLVEAGVSDIMEINCSALGFGTDVRASVCEMPVAWEDFLTYEDKYIRGGKSGKAGMQSLSRQIPAPISEELSLQIREMTKMAFRLFDCKGVVRLDFIYDKSAEMLYINEINTIPGSFAFYLWENEYTYKALITRLVELAEIAHEDRRANTYAFGSEILSAYGKGAKGSKGSKGR